MNRTRLAALLLAPIAVLAGALPAAANSCNAGKCQSRTYFGNPATGPSSVSTVRARNPWNVTICGIPCCKTCEDKYQHFLRRYSIEQARSIARMNRLCWKHYNNGCDGGCNTCSCNGDSCDANPYSASKFPWHKKPWPARARQGLRGKGGCSSCGVAGCDVSGSCGCEGEYLDAGSCGSCDTCSSCDTCEPRGKKCTGFLSFFKKHKHKKCGTPSCGASSCGMCDGGYEGCSSCEGCSAGSSCGSGCCGSKGGLLGCLKKHKQHKGAYAPPAVSPYPGMNREDAVRFVEGFQYNPPYQLIRSPRDHFMFDVKYGIGQ
ncbi:hypothetical protein Pan216_01720 [Planctomycetes bacterium Pan216]|uniref:TNFR-Cys domain-containing protein n=1 Tax=Kolteria novifilia TaxID=2527975 RepID=A0A518AXA9_9BACT|nr:hypothetical protein Pan216_01720 [Planctomycetes bacterium Pan216]